MKRFSQVGHIRGIEVNFHWSVFVICAFLLLTSFRKPAEALALILAYLALLLVHESGHLMVAEWRGSQPLSIEIYPIYGLAHFTTPNSRFDHSLIAWGGVAAQLVVALPFLAWVALFGYTQYEAINRVLVILGYFSIAMAIFNLLPIPPLDGATAWQLIPASYERFQRRYRNRRSEPPWMRP